jgi:SagB-type dehydrogenase family enzyme
MTRGSFEQFVLSDAMTDGEVWELFHENSKTTRMRPQMSDEQVYQTMQKRHVSLPLAHAPVIELPKPAGELPVGLAAALAARQSAREWPEIQQPLALEDLATLLHYTCGVTRPRDATGFAVDFRGAPSAGGLYPLELFFHAREVDGLLPGLYHYDAPGHRLHLVQEGDLGPRLASVFVQPEIPYQTTAQFFLVALFRRSTFKYRDRGYRFVLLEAGHIAQNLNLVATAMRLAVLNVGGYSDRALDEILEFDGINQSVVYVVAVGGTELR